MNDYSNSKKEYQQKTDEQKIIDIQSLIKSKDKNAVNFLILMLQDKSHNVIKEAINALIEIGDYEIPSLNNALGHRNKQVRHFTALILAQLGKKAIEPLIFALKDKYEEVRCNRVTV